jgi:hypothetical protein
VTQPYEIVEHSYDVVMSAPAAPDHAVRCGPAFFQSLTNGPQFAGILVHTGVAPPPEVHSYSGAMRPKGNSSTVAISSGAAATRLRRDLPLRSEGRR